MAHTHKNKAKLLGRVHRLQGQLAAVERALVNEAECDQVLQLIVSCHGALKGLMLEVLEGHIRQHVIDPDSTPTPSQQEAADELVSLLRSYLK